VRRRELSARWDEFYRQSAGYVEKLLGSTSNPSLDIKIGPSYPTDTVISREKVFEFLSRYEVQRSSGFGLNSSSRHPNGALLVRRQRSARYMNVGTFGTIHYIESLEGRRPEAGTVLSPSPSETEIVLPFWWIVPSVFRVLDLAAALVRSHSINCDLRIEATLVNVFGHNFYLDWGQMDGFPFTPGSSIASEIPAFARCSSEFLSKNEDDLVTELLYQLRWPLGSDSPDDRERIAGIVQSTRKSVRTLS